MSEPPTSRRRTDCDALRRTVRCFKSARRPHYAYKTELTPPQRSTTIVFAAQPANLIESPGNPNVRGDVSALHAIDKVLEGHEAFNIAQRLLPFPATFRNAQTQAFISTSESYC